MLELPGESPKPPVSTVFRALGELRLSVLGKLGLGRMLHVSALLTEISAVIAGGFHR